MNDADISLIISLAHGELDGQDRLAALERVEANPELARELAIQIEMIDVVADMPDIAAMTESERAVLRSGLIEQLHLESAPVVAIPTRSRVSWWQPVLGLASAAALVIAIIVVPGMLSTSSSSDDVAFTEVSSDLDGNNDSQPDTTGSGTERFATNESDSATLDAAPGVAGLDDTESITEVATTAPSSAPSPPQLFQVPDQREDEFNDIAAEGVSVAAIREKLVDSGFTVTASSINEKALDSCVDDLAFADSGSVFVPLGSSDRGTVYVGVDTGKGIDEIIEIDISTCTVVTTVP